MRDGTREAFLEQAAMCDEAILEKYLETGEIGRMDIVRLIRERKLFPCYFGSALKSDGVENFMNGLAGFARPPVYPESFGAKVYKISRDEQGNRLTHLKITAGA